MNKPTIFTNDWLHIHPYKNVQPSDAYFVSLANRLYNVCNLPAISLQAKKHLCLYLAAYLEDQISGLGLWKAFVKKHTELYGSTLPFYFLSADYQPDEVNVEDICFLIWNTWQKDLSEHPYVNPMDEAIREQALEFYPILSEAYEEAPENERLDDFFSGFDSPEEADRKLTWLFGHTYLTEPSMLPYIERVTPTDRFIIPVGPLALFLFEWIDELGGGPDWKSVEGLYTQEPELPASMIQKNAEIYKLFLEATGGESIVFLKGYEALHRFLVDGLKWPDDENHTLPQMKEFRNFVLMVNKEKGLLLAKDVCECLAAPKNDMYDSAIASDEAFNLLTVETACPPDLLTRSIQEGWLPDLQLPDGGGERELVVRNADFIARHSLLYYYRGD